MNTVEASNVNSRLLTSLLAQEQEATANQTGGFEPKHGSRSRSNSNVSASSGLTVIVDSPTRGRQRASASGTAGPNSSIEEDYSRSSGPNYLSPNRMIVPTTFRSHRSPLHLFADSLMERTRQAATNTNPGIVTAPVVTSSSRETGPPNATLPALESISGPKLVFEDVIAPKVKKFYRFKPLPWLSTRIWFDRLTLLAMLDRSASLAENFLSVLLAALVAVFAGLILDQGYYTDVWILLFCAVTASCQYSLLKSVQPDSASPTHGFNRIVVFSRPVYFVLCCSLVLLLQAALDCDSCRDSFVLYGVSFPTAFQLRLALDVLYAFILFFPLIFVLGLLPQVNTFVMFLFEQVDIHVFGGNATSSLLSSVYCILRSLIACSVLIGFAYGGLTGEAHSANTQEILFSIFCALVVTISYHLSRSSSDPTVILALIKRQLLFPGDDDEAAEEEVAGKTEDRLPEVASSSALTENQQQPPQAKRDDVPIDVEQALESGETSVTSPTNSVASVVDPLPKKLRDTVNARLKNDAIVCCVIAVSTFFLHWSGLFLKLQPNLNYVLWITGGVVGFMCHYILPQLRKQLPWLCFSHPSKAHCLGI